MENPNSLIENSKCKLVKMPIKSEEQRADLIIFLK
jgi:hypothetical protein